MTENVPFYVSAVFMLTAFLTVGILLDAVKKSAISELPGKLIVFLLAFWLIFQTILSQTGFYAGSTAIPPRLAVFGALPAVVTLVAYLIFFRRNFVARLSLKSLTLVHVVRIPVEIVLYWLSLYKLVPESMTFTGRNFDILVGITAIFVFIAGFRGEEPKRGLLLAWNLFGLAFLANIVVTAIAALPAFNPNGAAGEVNRAVEYFPYVWLPTVVVPIVLFSHLAVMVRLLGPNRESAREKGRP